MVVTSKPSMAACSALMGSISVTMTRAPKPRSECARALADVAVAADDRDLAGDHHVGGALEAVAERLAAAVEVVELRLRHRVVHVDGRHEQLARFLHLVEAMDAGGRLLGDAAPVLHDLRPDAGMRLRDALEEVLDDLFLVRTARAVHPLVALLELVALVNEERDVAAVVHDELRALVSGMNDGIQRAIPVFFEGLALPREDRRAGAAIALAA